MESCFASAHFLAAAKGKMNPRSFEIFRGDFWQLFSTYMCNILCCLLDHSECYDYMSPLLSGSDYIVNIQNPPSRTFTVTFQPKQLNATEHAIQISDDPIFEDKEHFRLRIHALRFIGGEANRFRVQPGVTSSFAEVAIKDNDGEFSIPSFTICALLMYLTQCFLQ